MKNESERIDVNKKQAESDIKVKALLVIEALCFGEVKITQGKQNELVYKFAHAALSKGVCKRCNHSDWEVELNQWYDDLIKAGII